MNNVSAGISAPKMRSMLNSVIAKHPSEKRRFHYSYSALPAIRFLLPCSRGWEGVLLMLCPQCGSTVRDGAAFCKNCGARIVPADNNTTETPESKSNTTPQYETSSSAGEPTASATVGVAGANAAQAPFVPNATVASGSNENSQAVAVAAPAVEQQADSAEAVCPKCNSSFRTDLSVKRDGKWYWAFFLLAALGLMLFVGLQEPKGAVALILGVLSGFTDYKRYKAGTNTVSAQCRTCGTKYTFKRSV